MQILTNHFMALKIAVGIIEDHEEDLNARELRALDSAIEAIKETEVKWSELNKRQAGYMKKRRAKEGTGQ